MPENKPTKKLGFDDTGKPYKGVSEKGERITIVLSELKKEFGAKRGEEMFERIREVHSPGPAIRTDGVIDERDLSLDGMKDEDRARVDAILAGKE